MRGCLCGAGQEASLSQGGWIMTSAMTFTPERFLGVEKWAKVDAHPTPIPSVIQQLALLGYDLNGISLPLFPLLFLHTLLAINLTQSSSTIT